MIYGDSIFTARRLHLFQRLCFAGWPHRRVSSLYIISSLFLSAFLFLASLLMILFSTLLILVPGLYLDIVIASPFSDSSIS